MKLNYFRIISIINLTLFGIIYNSDWDSSFNIYKCMDDSLETKGVCGYDKTISDEDGNYQKIIYLSKTCRRNQLCTEISDTSTSSLYKCQKVLKQRHEGKKCKTNGDCLSGKCDKKCILNKDSCQNSYACEKNSGFCNITKHECTKFVEKDKECYLNDVCEAKYGCNNPLNNYPGNCTIYGSLSDKDAVSDGIFCDSGIMLEGECVTVIKDSDCNSSNFCHPTIANGSIVEAKCVVYKKNPICEISKLKSSLFNDYIKKYNDTNTDKILKKKKFRLTLKNGYYFYNKKLMKKYYKYRYFEYFRSIGVMNEEGKVEKDCEFDYYMKVFSNNSAYYIKYFSIGILGLIFVLF